MKLALTVCLSEFKFKNVLNISNDCWINGLFSLCLIWSPNNIKHEQIFAPIFYKRLNCVGSAYRFQEKKNYQK